MKLPLLLLPLLWLTSCVGAGPTQTRYPTDVATALREQPMRRMETELLVVYYPEKRHGDAKRIAQSAENCARALKPLAKIHSSYADQKMTIVVPDLPFNNAFVAPSAVGMEPVAVIPTSNTLDFASELGLPPDPSYVACHEIVHYVQVLQVSGFWGWINDVFGDVFSPQFGLDAWFLEGLATYYESKLQPGTGRMTWPAWRGVFHAAFANKRLKGGDLSRFQRPFHWGHHYLVGSHFVEFLAQRYGEKALWKLIERQGDSILFPFGGALRWKSATGKTLPVLIAEFADAVETHFPVRPTPAEQKNIRSAGSAARYAVSRTGREALVVMGPDFATQLRIFQDGKQIRERELVDLVPPYTLTSAHPIVTSGLSFTADGTQLYFVSIDTGNNGQEERLLRYDIASDDLQVIVPRLNGAGGGVSGDGNTYYYGYADGDRRHLAAVDLRSKSSRIIKKAAPTNYYDHARPSPSGDKIVATVFNGTRFTIQVLDTRTGQLVMQVPFVGAVHDPSWISDDEILFLGSHEGRFQAHTFVLSSNTLVRTSDAPYLAFQARSFGDSIRFLNREGWSWNVVQTPRVTASENASPAIATTPIASPPETTAPKLAILSDKPYSQLDRLFVPTLRVPFLLSPTENTTLLGLSLSGGDRLGFHRWTLYGQYDLMGSNLSGGLDYVTGLLAPLQLQVSLSHLAWNEVNRTPDDMLEKGLFRTESRAGIAVSRNLRNSLVVLSAQALQTESPDLPFEEFKQRQLVGPELTLQHAAFRNTAYSDPHTGFFVGASAAHYSKAASSLPVDLTHIRAQLEVRSPLPFSKRHNLALGLRGQRLYGFDRDRSFLVVGGSNTSAELWGHSDKETPTPATVPAPQPLRSFGEALRGFEDLSFATDRIAIADLTYRLPLILDFGFASTAYLLPSWQFRQIDLELFASGATDSFKAFDSRYHFAAGASLRLATAMWLLPLNLSYQISQRFTDDEALVHSIRLGN